jgi:EAL domain-containing protein (putative c-di-GMP-specific phosphodiesterase class I)
MTTPAAPSSSSAADAEAGRLDLDQVLQNGRIAFWYQPKIDLRRKQLVGAEVCIRARHPQSGFAMPSAFLPGATESSLIALAELALTEALRAGLEFAKLGAELRLAVDMPAAALTKVPIADMVQSYRGQYNGGWPGLILDVAEDEILADLALANEIGAVLRPLDVKLAIDNFGGGYASLAQADALPFAEFKLNRVFVTDCATNRTDAPLCKNVIELAHRCGSVAVATGIEKAADALALMSMGCDYGQGFLLGQAMPEERFSALLRQRVASLGRQSPAASGVDRKLA